MASSKLITVLDIKDLLNDIIMPLSMDIDEIYYIYHHDIDNSIIENIKEVLNKHKKIKTHFYSLKDDDKEINKILDKHKDIIVDIGGGKYLSLVLFEKVINKDNLIVYYDGEENKIKSYRDHTIYIDEVFKLSIEDIVCIGGGKIIEQMHSPIDKSDIKSLEILNRSLEASIYSYSKFTSFIQKINALISKYKPNSGRIYYLKDEILRKIETDENYRKYRDLGLLKIEGEKLVFPTVAIAKLFGVSGAFLENYLYNKLIDSKKFDDVKMSCVIDFSGKLRRYPIVCEIDCLVIKDNHLLFVSCKSNKVDTGDLNEIKVHNTMFGNKLSSPVLCTLDDLNIKSPSVYGKARELGVAIVDNTAFEKETIPEEFEAIIKNSYSYERLG